MTTSFSGKDSAILGKLLNLGSSLYAISLILWVCSAVVVLDLAQSARV